MPVAPDAVIDFDLGCENLKKPEIQERITKLMQERSNRALQELVGLALDDINSS